MSTISYSREANIRVELKIAKTTMSTSIAHIVGIGISERTDAPLECLAVSAAAKALLDAGITYSEVDLSVAGSLNDRSRVSRSCFSTFGSEGAPILEVDNHSALFLATQCIRSRQHSCALVIGLDRVSACGHCHVHQNAKQSTGSFQQYRAAAKVVAVATVLVSSLFLMSHAYLKDGAIRIQASSLTERKQSSTTGKSNAAESAVQNVYRQARLEPKDVQVVEAQPSFSASAQSALRDFDALQPQGPPDTSSLLVGTTGLAGLCELGKYLAVSVDSAPARVHNCLQCTISPNGAASALVLCRSDDKDAPTWREIKDVRDGRERLGYNPATEKRGIACEDLEAVRSRKAVSSHLAASQLRLSIKGGDRAALARL
ncbi:hypothetical protein LTR53_004517 [Teratosphaeriaceae sp. CCFEE 6253]|nr:hypothetical protein LTR53_004517 [Teratosphaeriaceae sp. CCFEE 6253]